MAKELAVIEGKFILSINDVPRIREIFEGFDFQEVRLKYSISNGESTEAKELIISKRRRLMEKSAQAENVANQSGQSGGR